MSLRLKRNSNNNKTTSVSYDFIKDKITPPLHICSYKKGQIYKLARNIPNQVKIKGRFVNTDPKRWEQLNYMPFGYKIFFKQLGGKKLFWIRKA